ncbi:MAG TPA: serine--tRNA ligase [Solirubrobacteraceae bacterium]|nr:serine--tRNA ligase [Solirubrobacteraceae bacterium]
MLDLRLIREEPERVRAALARRGVGQELDAVLELDARRRALLPELEELRARKNKSSEAIAAARRTGSDAASAIEEMRALTEHEKELAAELSSVEEQLQSALAALPNLPADDAPDRDTVLREVGEAAMPVVPARDHLELAGPMIDIERAARVSGSRFAYLKGDLVLLEMGLVRWALERLAPLGFEPVIPPVLVREHALFGTGMLPDTEQQLYHLADDELFLVGTSEVPLASLHQGEILDASALPVRYAGFSTCFRREAGAAGRDTRGIFRVHQFDKVEMFSFVAPEDSDEEHERLLGIQEGILSELGIPYRVVSIGVPELGSSAVKKYDCEAWLPSQERYRELTSCSNTTDYQARRLEIRVRADGRPRALHTLNGTAVAVGRTIIALLENGQREDGSVDLPSCLVPYGVPERLPAQA